MTPQEEGGGSVELTFAPLTPDRWKDLEALFGPRGASGGCWCMWWRLSAAEYERHKGEANRAAMRHLVEGGHVPGILAYHDGQPVGWCSIAPRDFFPRLDRSRHLKRVDDTPVWSVGCFYVDKGVRRRGVAGALLRAALAYAKEQGAEVVEGYPIEPGEKPYPAFGAWTGFAAIFRGAGFEEALRRAERRPIVRYRFGDARKT